MALINCAECGAQISSNAPACPSCGNPMSNAIAERPAPVAGGAIAPHQAQKMGEAMSQTIVDHDKRKSSGGATGALIGAVLGYFLISSSCGFPETVEGFTITLLVWSPVILLGMLLGYFLGKAVG